MGYVLINPRIEGRDVSSKKSSSNDAASDIWGQLSSNIKNFVPQFYFTLQDTKTNGLSHFVVKESFKNDKVKYKLKQYKNKKMNDDEILKMFSQQGGDRGDRDERKRKDKYKLDDDDSSSSSSDAYVYNYPLGTSWKDSVLYYYPGIYNVPLITYPTWKFPFITNSNLVLSYPLSTFTYYR